MVSLHQIYLSQTPHYRIYLGMLLHKVLRKKSESLFYLIKSMFVKFSDKIMGLSLRDRTVSKLIWKSVSIVKKI